jgi:hypothetical protein
MGKLFAFARQGGCVSYRKLYMAVILVGVLSFTQSQVVGQKKLKIPLVSICDLIKNPEEFEGKNIRVNATYRYGVEWSELYCSNCWDRDERRIWVSFDSSFSSNTKSKIRKTLVGGGETGRTLNVDFVGAFYRDSQLPAGYDFKFIVTKASIAEIILDDSPIPPELDAKHKALTACKKSETVSPEMPKAP